MPRPANVIPSVSKNISIPKDLSERVDALLFSELEGKIPYQAQKEFFTALVADYFKRRDAGEPVPSWGKGA